MKKRTGTWRVGQRIESAFTLLEVLVVMMILSLVGTATALGLPNARDRIKVMQAGTWLNNTIANLRGQARREGRTIWIEFDLVTERYRLRENGWRTLPAGVSWEVGNERFPTTITRLLVFLPDGTGSGATFTIRSGGYSAVHRVEWFTGTIRNALH